MLFTLMHEKKNGENERSKYQGEVKNEIENI